MKTFLKPGRSNTDETLAIALQHASEKKIKTLLLASNTGETAIMLLDKIKKLSDSQTYKVVVITHVCEFSAETIQELSNDKRQKLEAAGCLVITAAHALSAGERSFTNQFGGISRIEVTAHILRMFGQGTKVALEIGLMARDAGAIKPDEPVLSIGGTGRGADTAVILTPGTSANLLTSKIHEILCKPGLYEGVKPS